MPISRKGHITALLDGLRPSVNLSICLVLATGRFYTIFWRGGGKLAHAI